MQKRLIDELGRIQSKIAVLAERERAIKGMLVAAGPGDYEGTKFNAHVSRYYRESINADAARDILSPAMLRKITRRTRCFRVTATAKPKTAAARAA